MAKISISAISESAGTRKDEALAKIKVLKKELAETKRSLREVEAKLKNNALVQKRDTLLKAVTSLEDKIRRTETMGATR